MNARPVIIGSGIGGLAAALELAAAGTCPIVIEKEARVGGKMAPVTIGETEMDGGPTVLTMAWVFRELFEAAGTRLEDHITLEPALRLARHFWEDGTRLDLFADLERSRDAIQDFAGPGAADGFTRYQSYARQIYQDVEDVFIRSPKPTAWRVFRKLGLSAVPRLMRIDARRSMWRALGDFFEDPRLRQLFGRYATYAGNNPFHAPATFNLIAHVEQQGVWRIKGGMGALAQSLRRLIESLGGEFRLGRAVDNILIRKNQVTAIGLDDGQSLQTSICVFNGDISALGQGLLGSHLAQRSLVTPARERSLSAMTWCAQARVGDFPLIHHNVFFSKDYAEEFKEIETQGRSPQDPTVYVCAQDRADVDGPVLDEGERLLILVNAPALADVNPLQSSEIDGCRDGAYQKMARMGLELKVQSTVHRGPREWDALFPGTGGAIYGKAARTWNATLKRSGSTCNVSGLYLAGGSIHPGAGVPMAALSGRMAASQVLDDYPSIRRSRPAVTCGGTSMPSATTDSTRSRSSPS